MVDVDGVVVTHPHPRGWSATLEADLGLSPDRLHESFFVPHWNDIVLGRASLQERLGPVLAAIAPHLDPRALADYWFHQDAHLDRQLLDELAALRNRGMALHLATVQDHERAAYLWNVLGLRDRFDAIHYSAALGCAKPSPAFFALVEARSGFSGHELFFIDDKAANVKAARTHGWKAAIWNGRERLADLLADMECGCAAD